MFHRLQSSLPKDPVFPKDLKELGYFIDKKDEIKSIENPKAYYKFFKTKNDRTNCMQQEAFNECVRKIVLERLERLTMERLLLPFDAQVTDPSVLTLVSRNIVQQKRVIILFYEHTQDLGIFAYRIIGGKGGINQGSAVDFVNHILYHKVPQLTQPASIILANMGQLRWSRKYKKAMTQVSWLALPRSSAVEQPFRMDEIHNTIPGNRNGAEHVNYIFNEVVEQYCPKDATIQVIGVSDGATKFFEFLDDFRNFQKWASRISAFAAVAPINDAGDIRTENFKSWLANRGRAYVMSHQNSGLCLAGPEGGKRSPSHGCPTFSLGEAYYTELLFPKGYKVILDWLDQVSHIPGYVNPTIERSETCSAESDCEDGSVERGWDIDFENQWLSPTEVEKLGTAKDNEKPGEVDTKIEALTLTEKETAEKIKEKYTTLDPKDTKTTAVVDKSLEIEQESIDRLKRVAKTTGNITLLADDLAIDSDIKSKLRAVDVHRTAATKAKDDSGVNTSNSFEMFKESAMEIWKEMQQNRTEINASGDNAVDAEAIVAAAASLVKLSFGEPGAEMSFGGTETTNGKQQPALDEEKST
ncbi:Arb2 domain-containing protein [Amylocarpus encephaloides]|uniref:Arb2 domain-containing protein n=1 Tax=Amylocarpus encephaloides TaxID=45428 RepID=A0A9P8C6C0_9HELO|nr:Arb2 domain-containing protein [Amylocarpus encephaloides]